MGIANIVNTAGGGGGSSEIITHLVNSVDGAGLRLANQGYISCADVSANRFGTNDFSVEFVLSQETSAVNADIFISNFNSSNQAVDAAVIRWDVVQNDNIQLVFTNSGAAETAYNFGYDPAPDLNEPTHYLVSADRSGNAVLYRNGAEIASVSIAASGSANVGNSGQPTVIGSPVNNFGVKGNVYRFRTYSKALSSDEAKNVFDRADVPTALVSNLLLDLDCAYANPTQSTVIQDRGPNNQDGTLNGTITQTNVIKQLNSTSARIGTTQATPADGDLVVSGMIGVGNTPSQKLTVDDSANDMQMRIGSLTNGIDPFVRFQGSASDGTRAYSDFGVDAANQNFYIKAPKSTTPTITALTISSTGQTTLTSSNQNVLYVNRTTSNGEAIVVEAAGTDRVRIGTEGITFPNGGTAPAAAANNQLDYYGEGSWTPTLVRGGSAITAGVAYSNQAGNYTRIGNVVYYWFDMTISTLDNSTLNPSSGNFGIGGLPFTSAAATAGGYGAPSFRSMTAIPTSIRNNNNSSFVQASSTYIALYWFNGSPAEIPLDTVTTDLTTGRLTGEGFYFTS